MYAIALSERNYPLRVDILMIYDLNQLALVAIDGDIHSLAFRFRQPDQKQVALLGLIKITE